jgi:FkbM family methyltransferase
MKTIREIVKAIIPKPIKKLLRKAKHYFFDGYASKSYSQEGEDMILSRIFGQQKKGFYVDVGACHPTRFSNTYFFYKRGWRGINIDAMPKSMKLFKKLRPRDINLEIAISDQKQIRKYYTFNEPALNSFSKNVSEEHAKIEKYKIISTYELETKTLEEVLDNYLPANQEIDFLSIDVEGLDFEALKSNNWEKYRPKIVLVEVLKSNLENLPEDEVCKFMIKERYNLLAKSVNTAFFARLDI